MAKKNIQVSKGKEDIHYPNIPLYENNSSNSILTVNNNCQLSKDEKSKLLDYFVINPINLKEKSRKYYNLRHEKDVDFKKKELRESLRKVYDFDNDNVFLLLKPNDTINVMSEWFENCTFPSKEIISLERICIKSSYGNSKIPALIWFVRNCICHGNFEIVTIGNGKKYIVLEDNTGSVIRGRGTILLANLFKLIEKILDYSNGKII